jgi:hypothetical protein
MSVYKTGNYQVIKTLKNYSTRDVLDHWIADLAAWAKDQDSLEAKAVKLWLPTFKVRPIYTAAELCPIFPALSLYLKFSAKWVAPMSPARMKALLEFSQMPKLKNVDGSNMFKWSNKFNEYFIVGHVGKSQKLEFTQEEFERIMA